MNTKKLIDCLLEKEKEIPPEAWSIILLNSEKERRFIIRALLAYLKLNPKVKIDRLSRIESPLDVKSFSEVLDRPPSEVFMLKYKLDISYHCQLCNDNVEEVINLACTWYPQGKANNILACGGCQQEAREQLKDQENETVF
ncbi:hypothetical protein KAW50_03495 [candidate division WOR-3 bacterium]|nr:hypothetical protein [candidate division WOR-3 bacterium]